MKDLELVQLTARAAATPGVKWSVWSNNMLKGPVLQAVVKYRFPKTYIRFRFREDDEVYVLESLSGQTGESTIRYNGILVAVPEITILTQLRGDKMEISITYLFKHRTTLYRLKFQTAIPASDAEDALREAS